jgi:hypothetical protein
MRTKAIRSAQLGSLLDAPGESARKMLLACVPGTMSFWIDHNATIHAVVPEHVPAGAEALIIGTYSIGGASLAQIEEDLIAQRHERAGTWSE